MAAAVALAGSIFSAAAGAVSAFAATAVGGIAVKLITTVAVSALATALAPDPPQGGGITLTTTVRGEDHAETIILGRYATGGQAICPEYSHGDSNLYLTRIIELCSAPGAQISRVMLGDGWVELGETEHADYGRPVLGDDYGGLVWIKYYDGSQAAADPMLRAKYGSHPDRPWTADMVGEGLCYAIMTFLRDEERLAQVPRYRFEMTGLPLYDIRKDSTRGGSGSHRLNDPSTWEITHNPIVMAWNIMRGIPLPGGEVYGGGIADLRRLPQAVWVNAMNRCDVAVAKKGGGTDPAYRAGLEISLDSPPAAALEELFKAASATVADLGYGWGVAVGGPGLPVYSFTDVDVIISKPQELDAFPGLADTYNAVAARFPDPGHFWETKEAPKRTNAGWEAADAFGRRTASLALPAVPYKRQVQRLMRAWAEDERPKRIHAISLPPDSAHVELIDEVDWTSEHNGYIGKDFRVHEIVEDPRIGVRQFSLRERDPADNHWEPDFELPSPPDAPEKTPDPVLLVPGFGVSAVMLRDSSNRPRIAGIRMVWDGAVSARGLRWQVRQAGETTPDLTGDLQDVSAGRKVIYQGILGDTAYEVRARLIGRKTGWTAWLPAVTDAIQIGLAEISQEVLDRLEALEERMDLEDRKLEDLLKAIDEGIEAVQQRVTETRADLTVAATALQGEIEAALGLAREYTDTGILTESATRQSAVDSLAGRIDELTAALVSDNLISNGDFSDGWNGWTRGGTTSRTARDESSGTPLIATMPKPFSVVLAAGGSWVEQITETFEVGADDALQFRFSSGGDSGSRLAEIRVRWLDADDTQIGPEAVHPIAVEGFGIWRRIAGRLTPPSTLARSAVIRLVHTTSAGSSLRATGFEAAIVNTAVEARIAELEAAKVTLEAALATQRSEMLARFGVNEAAILAEGIVRADADTAAADRLTVVEASTGANTAAINAQATTIGNTNDALAALDEEVSARIGAAELVRDGAFARALTYWPGGLAPVQMFSKAASGYWVSTQAPAKRFLQISAGATGQRVSPAVPVMAGEILDLSFAYAREASGVIPIVHYRFRRADGTFVNAGAHGNSAQRVHGTGSGAWLTATQTGIPVPVGAVTAEVVLIADDGTTHCWITLISLRRRQAFDHLVSAEVASHRYALADPDGALAMLRNTVTANWNDLDNRASAIANAISNIYTKTEANSAIAAGIQSYDVSLPDKIANASSILALTNRVTDTETVANSKNRVWRQSSAPTTGVATGDIWFNTSNRNKPSRWSGSSWQSIEDGDIPALKSDVEAHSTALIGVQARTDRGTAAGRLRVTATSGPSGVQSRLVFSAEANSGDASHGAAFYLEARSDGTSAITPVADRFAIVTGDGVNAPRKVPFIVELGAVYMDTAIVKNLSVERLKLADGSVTTIETSYTAGNVSVANAVGWQTIQELTYTVGRTGRQVVEFNSVVGASAANRGEWDMRLIRVGLADPIAMFDRSRFGTNINQREMHAETISGHLLDAVDTGNLTGGTSVTYRLQVQAYFASVAFSRRFMRVFNAHK